MNLDRCGPGLKTGLHQKTRGETITVYVYTRFALHARDNTPSPRLCTKKSTRLLRELRRISLHAPPSKGNTDWVGSVVLVSHKTYFLLKKHQTTFNFPAIRHVQAKEQKNEPNVLQTNL